MDEASRARIDDLLFAVTQQSQNGVHGLLDSVYGFLQRRTDFYYEAEPGDKMGFPPGIAESMVSDTQVTKYFRFTNISADIKRCIKRGFRQSPRPRRDGKSMRSSKKLQWLLRLRKNPRPPLHHKASLKVGSQPQRKRRQKNLRSQWLPPLWSRSRPRSRSLNQKLWRTWVRLVPTTETQRTSIVGVNLSARWRCRSLSQRERLQSKFKLL